MSATNATAGSKHSKPSLTITIDNSNTTEPKRKEETSVFQGSTPSGSPNNTNNNTNNNNKESEEKGWNSLEDGKFRVSLQHHYRDTNTDSFLPDFPHSSSPSPPRGDEKDLINQEDDEEEVMVNVCDDEEPQIQFKRESTSVNAINSAYTSSGYPSVSANSNIKNMVYGSFVDTRCCSLHSLNLPPKSTLLFGHCRRPSHVNTNDKETLLKVLWKRAPGIFSGEDGGSVKREMNTPARTGAAQGKNVKEVLHAHIQQYPEGIHGVNSSPFLSQLLLQGQLPTKEQIDAEIEKQVKQQLEARPNLAEMDPAERGQLHNVAPPPLPLDDPTGPCIQHTLLSANTYNHLTTYFIAHQDSKIIYHTPIQTISASITTRKLTAHCLFMSTREEVNPSVGGSSNDLYYEFFSSGSGQGSPCSPNAPPPPHNNNDNKAGERNKRENIPFQDIPLTEEEAELVFEGQYQEEGTGSIVDADETKRTVSCGFVSFVVEPLLLMGNQNGDLFIFSILQEKVVQRMNFNGGSSQTTDTTLPSSPEGTGGSPHPNGFLKVVTSQVSAIVEVESGVERKMTNMAEYATVAKRNGKSSFRLAAETDSRVKWNRGASQRDKTKNFYDVPPSLFAVGFDNGHFLLVCVTVQEGYMLSHYSNDSHGLYSIRSVSVRVPCFFTRLWTSFLPSLPPAPKRRRKSPQELLLISESMLFIHNEENQIAAIACNGGTIALARLPSMEVLAAVSAYEYHAVGNILSLCWAASSAAYLASPDLLFASGEDDMLTAFQLNSNVLFTANSDVYSNALPTTIRTPVSTHGLQATPAIPLNSNNNSPAMNQSSSEFYMEKHSSSTDDNPASPNGSNVAGGLLRILEKKKFHRSWITHIDPLPLVLPASKTVGMPQHVGVSLVCTSFDNTVSFWPLLFPPGNTSSANLGEGAASGGGGGGGGGNSSAEYDTSFTGNNGGRRYYIVDGPTAAFSLDTDLTTCTAVAGGGTSYFMVSLCCRGKVKLWSVGLCNL